MIRKIERSPNADLDDLKELIRFVVFETVREIRQQEKENDKAITEHEELLEQIEEAMGLVRSRAVFLAGAMKQQLGGEVLKVQNSESVELMVTSGDYEDSSIRLQFDQIRARRADKGSRVWVYDTGEDYASASVAAVRWLKSGKE